MKTIPSVLRFLPIATTVFAGDPSAIAQSVVPAAPPGNAAAPLATRHSTYGVCAHLIRHDADFRDRECAAIAALGAKTVRFGVS